MGVGPLDGFRVNRSENVHYIFGNFHGIYLLVLYDLLGLDIGKGKMLVTGDLGVRSNQWEITIFAISCP
jgi:hypothetical protein